MTMAMAWGVRMMFAQVQAWRGQKRTLLLGETSTDDEDVTLPPARNLKPASKKAKGSSNLAKRSKDTPSTGPIKKLPTNMVRDGSSRNGPPQKLPDVVMLFQVDV